MSNENTYHIRVTLNGNEPKFEMMHGNMKIGDMTYIEVLELAMQATSSLRWIKK